nr:reverse transcriptase domain-containing protein [Tanacetum cinerariifolium]
MFRKSRSCHETAFTKDAKRTQSLNEKLAILSRFLLKSAEKSLPFFKTLKKCMKKSDFQWTVEVEKAFQEIKKHITKIPLLTAPRPKEDPIMYLYAAKEAINMVLLAERDSKQMPIYFISRALQAPEINYDPMENMILALVHASRRLRRMHSGPRSVVARATRSASAYKSLTKAHTNNLTMAFYKQWIDISGPFPEAQGKVKFLIVAIDYFTKWIEAKLVATITGNQVKKFIWDNIICMFGLSGEIVSDNRKQFRDNPFKDWCEKAKHQVEILDSRGAIPTKTVADAKVAIQEMEEYSQKWHNGTFRGISTETSDGLATIQAQLNNIGREI